MKIIFDNHVCMMDLPDPPRKQSHRMLVVCELLQIGGPEEPKEGTKGQLLQESSQINDSINI